MPEEEEKRFILWCGKRFTKLTGLAVIDKELRGIYRCTDISSSIAHTSVF